MMTFGDFIELVKNDDLNDAAIERRWKSFCEILLAMDVDHVREMIKGAYIDGAADFEEMDGFGTAGMRLR